MMKVGIINMQYSRHNYGALLQAAVLEHITRQLTPGCTVEHIDIRAPWQNPKAKKAKASYFERALNLVKNVANNWPTTPRDGNFEVFSRFRDQYINLTKKSYITDEEFTSEDWDYDIVIVGSDQVFRAHFIRHDVDIYFLRFLPTQCRRIAYAASFGVDSWEGADDALLTEKVRKALGQFQAVSVREHSGVDICNDVFGVSAQHVLDPTLLAGREYFDQIIATCDKDIYMPDWAIHHISNDAKFIEQIPVVAKKKQKVARNIYYKRLGKWPFRPTAEFSSVPEWLALIRGAHELVLTDSYHCVCFCILFRKEFIVFLSEDKGTGRMRSLLNLLGLEHRICTSAEMFEEVASGTQTIDYDVVEAILVGEREKAWAFLKDNI
jgi:hypothetical protein